MSDGLEAGRDNVRQSERQKQWLRGERERERKEKIMEEETEEKDQPRTVALRVGS